MKVSDESKVVTLSRAPHEEETTEENSEETTDEIPLS